MRDLIRSTLANSGLSKREVARRAALEPIYVRRLLGDEHDILGQTAYQIARALGLELVDSLGVRPRGGPRAAIASRAKRQDLGPSAIAAKVGCDKATVSRYLRGEIDCQSEVVGAMMALVGLRVVAGGLVRG